MHCMRGRSAGGSRRRPALPPVAVCLQPPSRTTYAAGHQHMRQQVRQPHLGLVTPVPASAIFALATTPMEQSGERFPVLAPLVTISAVRKGGHAGAPAHGHGHRHQQRHTAIAPGPTRRDDAREEKEQQRQQRARCPAPARRARSVTRSSVPLALGRGKEQRDARQGEKERNRKPSQHRFGAQARRRRRRPATPARSTPARRSPASRSRARSHEQRGQRRSAGFMSAEEPAHVGLHDFSHGVPRQRDHAEQRRGTLYGASRSVAQCCSSPSDSVSPGASSTGRADAFSPFGIAARPRPRTR